MTSAAPASPPSNRFVFYGRRTFWWKTGLLLATTIALIPILLMKDEGWAKIYLWALIAVHVGGIFVVAIGVRRHQIAPNRRGFWSRVAAIVTLVALLYLASAGLKTQLGGFVFWGSLFAIWALHTMGLALLHIRSGREAASCPFA